MVYQQPNWIRSLTVCENIAFPLLLLGQNRTESLTKAKRILSTIEMVPWADYVPTELSSGQQQRAALARALITNPEVIIADEPTGNLDYESGQELMRLLADLNGTYKKTILMVTHDLEYLNFAKTAVRMFNGEIVGIYGKNDKDKLLSEIKSKRGPPLKIKQNQHN
jgi:ABC-type lipoprotein export system ATPase subunit